MVGSVASRAFQALALAGVLMFAGAASAAAIVPEAKQARAAALLERYASLKGELGDNRFKRPVHLESTEGQGEIAGEIFARVDHPLAVAGAAMTLPSQWCDILILHLNTKYCRPSTDGGGTVLRVSIGNKYNQPLEKAYRIDFAYRVVASSANYLKVTLAAPTGPLGTSDYRIVLEAVPVEAGRTFIRLSYSYSYGAVGKLAMQVYLGTLGREKVGFTVIGRQPDDLPRYIGGMRGVVERNAMRYYLAIEAHLGALSLPAKSRMEQSLGAWFTSIERFPRQLHEMEREAYLEMKRKEYARQQEPAPAEADSGERAGTPSIAAIGPGASRPWGATDPA